MAVDVRAKACSYLRAGAVKVHVAMPPAGARLATHIEADVEGHSSTYVVRLTENGWTCTCGRAEECAHAAAVQICTGWPSLARKEPKGARRAA
ncbi:hypothetical protein AB0I81_22490 [Nonomuraea sp. NPDC050404]|uniref:hypothetical protein n=1 Tax=Nonomuraea sp. NPDC050404 TaxID=3155783 RepID=UPI0033F24513